MQRGEERMSRGQRQHAALRQSTLHVVILDDGVFLENFDCIHLSTQLYSFYNLLPDDYYDSYKLIPTPKSPIELYNFIRELEQNNVIATSALVVFSRQLKTITQDYCQLSLKIYLILMLRAVISLYRYLTTQISTGLRIISDPLLINTICIIA